MNSARTMRAGRCAFAYLRCIAALGCLTASPAMAGEGSFLQSTFAFAKPDSNRYEGKDLAFQLTLGQDLTPRLGWFASYQANEFLPAEGGGLLKQRAFDLGTNIYWGNFGSVRAYSPAAFGMVDSRLGDERQRSPSASLGVGYTLPIPWAPNLQVVNEVRGRYSYGNPYASNEGTLDAFGALGLKYSFSAAPPPRKSPPYIGAPSPVIAPPTDLASENANTRSLTVAKNKSNLPDADEDGVKDSLDRCPNSVFGVQVDTDGCTI